MRENFSFNANVLGCVFGGHSVIDIAQLDIHDLEKAKEFIRAYGYNLDDPKDHEEAWGIHRRAIGFLRDKILEPGEEIPELLVDPKQLKDLGYLLIYVSTQEHQGNMIQKWACALLRVMHVVVHLRNDLFSVFYEEIQEQVLSPMRKLISVDPLSGTALGGVNFSERIKLHRFDVKPLKSSDSSIVKMLAKPSAVALYLFDKLGVRFVTRNLFDAFKVARFLVDHHLLSFPHILPDQSNNSLYPYKIFLEVMDEVKDQVLDADEVEKLLVQKLKNYDSKSEKVNLFSGDDYRFLKFINRQLIRVNIKVGEKTREISFFYPYEIQIMNYETYLKNISGPESHDQYKERQRLAARRRVLGIRDS